MQQMKRLGVGSGSEEDPTHSGEFYLHIKCINALVKLFANNANDIDIKYL